MHEASLSPQEKRIRQLENDLYMARALVLDLTGPDLHEVLYPPSNLEMPRAAHAWLKDAMDQVIGFADVITIEEPLRQSQRAVCPLCRGDAQDFNRPGPGYVFPRAFGATCWVRTAATSAR